MTRSRPASEGYLVCPLCGFEFAESDTLCEHGCPFRAGCPLSRCPSCGYEFAERPRPRSWIGTLRASLGFGRRLGDARCEQPLSIRHLERGETVTVRSLPAPERRRNTLAVFGLIPGSEVTLLQKRPAFVIRVGETELALDEEIAAEILVERAAPAGAGQLAAPIP